MSRPERADRLRRAWDSEADAWIAWARAPDHDHFFWRLTLPALVGLLPEPGALTVDVRCGERRVARELKERGHAVVGIEGSEALAAAAREADPDFEAARARVSCSRRFIRPDPSSSSATAGTPARTASSATRTRRPARAVASP